MTKFAFECAIFGFILFQLISLTSFTNKDGDPAAEAIQNVTIAAYEPVPSQKDPFETFMNAKNDETTLPEPNTPAHTAMSAQLEAMRIVENGDIDGYLDQVDQNPLAKMLLGL